MIFVLVWLVTLEFSLPGGSKIYFKLNGFMSKHWQQRCCCLLYKSCFQTLILMFVFPPQGRLMRWPLTLDTTKTWWRSRWASTTWQQRRSRGTYTVLCLSTQPFRTRWASPPSAGSSLPTLSEIPTSDTVRYTLRRLFPHELAEIEWRLNT